MENTSISQGPTIQTTVNSAGSSLDFESQPSLESKSVQPTSEIPLHRSIATGLSIILFIVLLLNAWKTTKYLLNASLHNEKENRLKPSKSWHVLSLLSASFLGLNVFFGGLTAFLLTGRTSEDADAYFQELSPFKLARLSHEHFFGYAISFGLISLLSFVFVGQSKRTLFPCIVLFGSGFLDALSWWLSRYANLGFHTLAFLGGAGFSAAFLFLYINIAMNNVRGIFSDTTMNEGQIQ